MFSTRSLVTVWLLSILALLPLTSAFADADLDDELTRAWKATPNLGHGRELFKKICAQCHGPEAWGTPDGHYPQLAGQHRSVLIKQLADIRAGNRDNPEMAPYARVNALGYQGIADVTAYAASLPMNPKVDAGPGDQLPLGEHLFKHKCARCHGDDAEGSDIDLFPSLYGQHYGYVLRQLRWIQAGKRRNVYRGMVRVVSYLSDKDLMAVADYVSRFRPPAAKVAPPGWRNMDIRGPGTDRHSKPAAVPH